MRERLVKAALVGMWGEDLASVYIRNGDVRFHNAVAAIDAVLAALSKPTDAMVKSGAMFAELSSLPDSGADGWESYARRLFEIMIAEASK